MFQWLWANMWPIYLVTSFVFVLIFMVLGALAGKPDKGDSSKMGDDIF